MHTAWVLDTPLGPMTAVSQGDALTALTFGERLPPGCALERTPLIANAAAQLGEYFAGKRQAFDLPLQPRGTAFQQTVWQALQQIPYGQTRSYGFIAAAVGRPQATRAVGGANHRNPLSILIPCHRVIGADGSLTGYGGGLHIKQALLLLEQTHTKELCT